MITQRDNAKVIANLSGCLTDRELYCKLRNKVTKLNKNTKREYYQQKISNPRYDSKEIWKTLNEIMRRKSNMCSTYVDCEGVYITKPQEIGNYFNIFFINKVEKLRATMIPTQSSLSYDLSKNNIMRDKRCTFEFKQADAKMVERMSLHLSDDTSPGIDNMDGRLFKVATRYLSAPICHIFNRFLTSSLCI